MTPMPADPDCAALFRGVLAAPSDPLPKLVLADWLDEHEEPVLAHAFRWCAARGRHPKSNSRWTGGSWRDAFAKDRSPECLPLTVAQKVTGTCRNYTTEWDAFAALADALEEIAAVARLPAD